ncbi:MAG: hypothetical protein KDE19_25030 [Caldilineaceae bacterium]|nr:hypothetical protein [Caldilineaceae bacterium]
MTNTYATAEECRPLFALMDQVKELAPWEWMTETEIFGVQAADAAEPDYVSVMGMAGEHYAVALYLGNRALTQFMQMETSQPFANPLDLLLIPQLQASFEDRNTLTDKDRTMLKTLGLKYRGRNAWPQLRAQQPACLPWYIETTDVPRIANALEQLLVVAPRVKSDPALLRPKGKRNLFLRKTDGQEWVDATVSPKLSTQQDIPIQLDAELVETVRELPRVTNVLEVDLDLLPTPIGETNQRPYFPYSLLVVESESGMVLESDILSPLPSLSDMWAEVPNRFLGTMAKLGVLPQQIHVQSNTLAALLGGLEQLDLQIELVDELSSLNQAKDGLLGFLSRGSDMFG